MGGKCVGTSPCTYASSVVRIPEAPSQALMMDWVLRNYAAGYRSKAQCTIANLSAWYKRSPGRKGESVSLVEHQAKDA